MDLNEALHTLKLAGCLVEKVINGKMPEFLYHGTPKRNVNAILKDGLKVSVESRNYSISNECIDLAFSAKSAAEWAQRADFSSFTILKIDTSYLDPDYLELDYNMESDWEDDSDIDYTEVDFDAAHENSCFSYGKDIPAKAISIVWESDDNKKDLMNDIKTLVRRKDWKSIFAQWDELADVKTSNGTLQNYVANELQYLKASELEALPAEYLNAPVGDKTVYMIATSGFMLYPEHVADIFLNIGDDLNDENITYLWQLYTKPAQRKTFDKMKQFSKRIIKLGRPYIMKKFLMELDEALETLNKAGFIVEDKYMDDMENELDQTISLNNILDTIKKLYKKCGIKRDVIYVWPVEENERYCVGIRPNKYISIHRPYDFLCFILDREKRTYKMEWGYSITKDDEYSYSPCISPVPVFDGPVKDILKPGEKTLTKLNKPGLFKRIFGKKKVQESYKNEIPDDVMELAEEVFNHFCYDLDWDVYTLAEMGKDWLKDYLRELNDKEMRIACV